MKYKNELGEWVTINVRALDSLPVGTELEYDGTDIPAGWEQVDDPHAYSTNEQVIGTWVDGKPLYRRTINTYTLTSETAGTQAIYLMDTIPNILIKDRQLNFVTTFGGYYYDAGLGDYGTTLGKYRVTHNTNENKINVVRENYNAGFTVSSIELTICYTKTTDSASRSIETISNEETPVEEETR